MSLNVIIPVLAAFSPWLIGHREVPGTGSWPEWIQALLWGAIVGLIAYVLYRIFASSEGRRAEKAVLLGLLAAEILVVHRVTSFPPWAMTTLFLFFYFNAMEKRE
jgi:chromate transport protein ChrA